MPSSVWKTVLILLGWTASALPTSLIAKVSLPLLFSSNQVLQRDQPIPVWGKAKPGEWVRVSLGEVAAADSVADAAGAWRVELPAQPAGGPHKLVVAGETSIVLENILLGDVWLASGQSNMRMELARCADAEKEIAEASHPQIRLFTVPAAHATSPRDDLGEPYEKSQDPPGWQVCTPESAARFAGAAYFFARKVHRETGVPVGILLAAVGGTPIEAFLPADTIRAMGGGFAERMRGLESKTIPGVESERKAALAAHAKGNAQWEGGFARDDGMADGAPLWVAPNCDDSGWGEIDLPLSFVNARLPRRGTVWLRRTFPLPSTAEARAFELHLGRICDSDQIWINGKPFASTDDHRSHRRYLVNAGMFKPGPNTIAMRIESRGSLRVLAMPGEMKLAASGFSLPLEGRWKFRYGYEAPERPDPPGMLRAWMPSLLHNGMIHPLAGLRIKGVIWNQGESNKHDAGRYAGLFRTMIEEWRRLWASPNLPFYWVETANHGTPDFAPGQSAVAEIRDAQRQALALPHTGMAAATDIGDALDIHYPDKKSAGERLARLALHHDYGFGDMDPHGPVFRSVKREGKTLVIDFDGAKGGVWGLRNDGTLGEGIGGFTVGDGSGQFFPANAVARGGQVVVWSDQVAHPLAARYAWLQNPLDANLVNAARLPAVTFQTGTIP